MKIAIISDIHNNEVNLKKVLDFCARENVEAIVCCGDLASKEVLDLMNDNFSGKIYYTFGNADYDDVTNLWTGSTKKRVSDSDEKVVYKNTFLYKDFGEAIVENKSSSPAEGEAGRGWRIAFVHYPDIAKSLARTGKYDFVFYGHTHKPWIVNSPLPEGRQRGVGVTLLNPGTTGGEIYPPTFALWDTTKTKEPFQLIRIHKLK